MWYMNLPDGNNKRRSSHTTWYDLVRHRREEDIEQKLYRQHIWVFTWSWTGLLRSLLGRLSCWTAILGQRLQTLAARRARPIDVASEAPCREA